MEESRTIKYGTMGDITLADAFYELIKLVTKAMDQKIMSGTNPKEIHLSASLTYPSVTPEFRFKYTIN